MLGAPSVCAGDVPSRSRRADCSAAVSVKPGSAPSSSRLAACDAAVFDAMLADVGGCRFAVMVQPPREASEGYPQRSCPN